MTVRISSSCSQDVRTFAQGSARNINGIELYDLHGSWYEMGRQYGFLAKRQLDSVYAYLTAKTDGSPEKRAAVMQTAWNLVSHYPSRLLDFFKGCSETSGYSYEQLIFINAVEYAEADFFCSGLSVWDGYASGRLLYGRNYDCVSYSELCDAVAVTVYHPSDEAFPGATIGYAGELYAVNGINSNGVFFALDNGMPSAGTEIHYDTTPATTELFLEMFKAANIDDMDVFFKQTRSFASFLIGVADTGEARSYEWCFDGVKRGDGTTPDGMMAMANHYVSPEWPYPVPSDADSWNSITRRCNLIAQAEKHKGRIDVRTMQDIMMKPVREGGPLHDLTRYQFVAEPETRTIWVRVPGCCDWTEIALSPYLDRK